MMGPSSDEFYKKELQYFIHRLEEFSGRKLDDGKLQDAIKLYNRRRALLRELYELRKENPPRVSGTEITKVLVAGMGIPAAEHIELVAGVYRRSQKAPRAQSRTACRASFCGAMKLTISPLSSWWKNAARMWSWMICAPGRGFSGTMCPKPTIRSTGSLQRYLCTHCPRSLKPQAGNRAEDLENRFGYIRHFISRLAGQRRDFLYRPLLRHLRTGGTGPAGIFEQLETAGADDRG